MKVTKNGVTWNLHQQPHIDAFLADGWVEVVEEVEAETEVVEVEAEVNMKPRGRKGK